MLAATLGAWQARGAGNLPERQWGVETPAPPRLTYDDRLVESDASSAAIARFSFDAADWIRPAVIAARSDLGGDYQPGQVALFTDADGGPVLVVSWRAPADEWIGLYRPLNPDGGDVRLALLRRIDAGVYYDIALLSGDDLFPGEPAVVVIVQGDGPHLCDAHLRLIQLSGDTVEITPDLSGLPVRAIADLDGDGVAELISSGGPGKTCALLDGSTPAVMRRRDGQFVPACADFPEVYARWRDAELAAVPGEVDDRVIDVYRDTREALILAQAGMAGAGIELLVNTTERLHDDQRRAAASLLTITNERNGWHLPLTALLIRASRLPSDSCPLTAAYADLLDEWAAAEATAAESR